MVASMVLEVPAQQGGGVTVLAEEPDEVRTKSAFI